ncbi:MAG: fibronectin type III domain-containing protein [Saprospiraceae bacterium]|nr:fibronectin type III domain-containing protein [Saprospiraceae bacterium]
MEKKLYTKLLATLLMAMLAAFGFAQERSCATMDVLEQQMLQDPDLAARMESIERHTEDFIHQHAEDGSGRVVITIPVVFHIVHNGDALGTNENISDALVLAQLEQLNQDFALTNSDANLIPGLFLPVAANTEIQFCLAQRKPDGTATNGINRINGGQASWTSTQINTTLKPTTIWNRNQYLNIWSVVFGGSSSGLLGYAQFPGGNANTDGVVCLWSSIGSVATPNPSGGNYARGRTATHEVGHWLNLRHIWGDATCGNDFVDDTPVHNASNGGCPAFPHLSTCTGTPVEMTMNYMDYTFDACMYMFTAGQKARMQAVLAVGGSRFSLTTSPGCLPLTSTCGTPGSLSASAITATTATLTWGAVSGATSYNIQWRPVGTTTWSSTTSGTTSVAISGLNAGTQYEFQVQAVCSTGPGSFSASSTFTTTAQQSCGTPTNLLATSITAGSAVLSWTGVSGATSYNVQWRIFGTTTWSNGTTSNTSLQITGLVAGTQYEFQVQAVCGTTTGSFASVFKFTTGTAQGCGIPQGLNATNIGATVATLNWTAISGATSYNVRWRQTGTATWTTGSTSNTFLNISGLNSRTSYEFQVQAVCGATTGSYSDSASFSTGSSDSVCGTPGGLSATAITTTTATLNWAFISGAVSYNVQWRPTGSTTWSAGSTANTFLNISGLSAGTTYEFQVQAICGSLSGTFSASANFTTTTGAGCGTPSGLNATAVTTTTATLNWAAVSGATSYNVQWRPTGITTWSTGSTANTFLNISGLSAGTTYEFQIQAVCSSLTGAFSASANFTTTAGASCGTPSGLNATAVTASSATLNWASVSGAVTYNVQWRPVGATTWSSGTTSNTSLGINSLSQITQYEFQVQAVCSSLTGTFSASANFTTLSAGGCLDNFEPNDIRSSALPLTPTDQDLSAQISSTGDVDWYRFSNEAGLGNVRIDLTNLPANYDLRLYRGGFQLAISQNSGTSPELIIYNNGVISSDLYAYVYSNNGAFSSTQCYTLRISLSSSNWRTDGSTDGEVNTFEFPVTVNGSGFSMFPNPAQTELTLDVYQEVTQPIKVIVSDMTGKVVSVNTYALTPEEARIKLDVSALPAGVYTVRMENGKATGTQKLMIVRP